MRPETPDTVKKWLPCLGCGDLMWTDRCHRFCKKCRRRIGANPVRSPHLISAARGVDIHAVELYEASDGVH